ncbi:plasmid pRiA4b ORF-3 family protein [Pseudarthrobacter sp. S9]|uniref:plasmid pRiA4b ORF-3 family protein n=1 Tax=Pseudarthrobacter sp. S9 TaxID=3418421 RepID=UPI003D061398
MEAAVTVTVPVPVPAYYLRVSIEGTEPEIWRRLLVPETITVPEFHLAIQRAFGWHDRHVYGIRGIDRHGEPRVIVGPDEAAEDIDAEPASGVVLFELLDAQQAGPTSLEYEYDFGDAWTHTVELMGPAMLSEATIACVDGANRGPVEDSGGPGGYARLAEILADRNHAEFHDAEMWFSGITGERATAFDVGAFDLDAASRRLALLSLKLWPQPVTPEERNAVLRPILWLLENAAGEGLELTKDGYLKPAMVRRTLDELGWHDELLGKGNREINARNVLNLRQHLQDWRLLRKRNGRLVLGPKGKLGLGEPDELWNLMVETIGRPEHDAVKLMTRLAARWYLEGFAPPLTRRTEVILSAFQAGGFINRSGDAIPEEWAWEIDHKVRRSLECLQLTATGVPFLRSEKDLSDGGLKFLLQVQALLGDR